MERAFKYRFYPTFEQENLLRRTLGCVRLVYNRALAARTEAWYQRQERIGYNQSSAMLTQWKQEEGLEFLSDVSSVPLQQGLRHLQTAFTNFWAGRAQYPNFKKKRNGGSAEFTKAAFRYRDGQVYLAKCNEPLSIRWSRQLPQGIGPSTITIRLEPSGRWTVSLLVDDAGWGELMRQLAYKALWYGRNFIQLERWFPGSKTCSRCGHQVDSLPLNVREWDCPKCTAHHNRDVNAALNHLAAGQAVLVCGATVRPEESKSRKAGATKQKPKS